MDNISSWKGYAQGFVHNMIQRINSHLCWYRRTFITLICDSKLFKVKLHFSSYIPVGPMIYQNKNIAVFDKIIMNSKSQYKNPLHVKITPPTHDPKLIIFFVLRMQIGLWFVAKLISLTHSYLLCLHKEHRQVKT